MLMVSGGGNTEDIVDLGVRRMEDEICKTMRIINDSVDSVECCPPDAKDVMSHEHLNLGSWQLWTITTEVIAKELMPRSSKML